MLKGQGRHRLINGRFVVRSNLPVPLSYNSSRGVMTGRSQYAEVAFGPGGGAQGAVPQNTGIRSFAKPTAVGINVGLISNDPHHIITMAREMYDNDALCGPVADTLADIPFGNFSLSGIPVDAMKPYLTSVDRVRAKTLMPVLTRSHLVDGAFLGSGLFDDHDKVWNAVIPQDLLSATVTPVPMFGSTPIVDIQIHQDVIRALRAGDERMQRYLKFLPPDMLHGGVVKLQPEATFYVPNRTLSHVPLGTSMFRKVMIIYILEKALARGTIEMAYRRQKPMVHIVAGDENWEPSISEMQELSQLFMAADLDPLGAVAVTRQGVSAQEMGGAGELWKWTDNMDILTSLKLKGLGMPDGLLGGDMALDSVSATLTVFINKTRQMRDYITRIFFYEKFFPYISITNGHRKDQFKDYQETGARFQSRASDSEVDMSDFITPTIAWHNSMRPEGDKEYLDLLQIATQMGVPVPIRIMASACGLEVQDLINSAPDDVEQRSRIAEYRAQIAGIDQAAMGGQQGDDGQQQQYEGGQFHEALTPLKRRRLHDRAQSGQFDKLGIRSKSNNHRHYTTTRERKWKEERANRIIASAASTVAKKINWLNRQHPEGHIVPHSA